MYPSRRGHSAGSYNKSHLHTHRIGMLLTWLLVTSHAPRQMEAAIPTTARQACLCRQNGLRGCEAGTALTVVPCPASGQLQARHTHDLLPDITSYVRATLAMLSFHCSVAAAHWYLKPVHFWNCHCHLLQCQPAWHTQSLQAKAPF